MRELVSTLTVANEPTYFYIKRRFGNFKYTRIRTMEAGCIKKRLAIIPLKLAFTDPPARAAAILC